MNLSIYLFSDLLKKKKKEIHNIGLIWKLGEKKKKKKDNLSPCFSFGVDLAFGMLSIDPLFR